MTGEPSAVAEDPSTETRYRAVTFGSAPRESTMSRLSRRSALVAVASPGIALAGCLDDGEGAEPADDDGPAEGGETDDGPDAEDGGESGDEPTPAEELPDWMTTELEDVTTEETFEFAEFDGHVLLETFAVWCPDCLEQQRASQRYQAETGRDVTSVALNVDPNEDADVVREHVDEHGFDWHFAVAPGDLTRSLVDEFGDSIAHPPASPMVLICPDGSFRRLDDGHNDAETLETEIAAGC